MNDIICIGRQSDRARGIVGILKKLIRYRYSYTNIYPSYARID